MISYLPNVKRAVGLVPSSIKDKFIYLFIKNKQRKQV